MSHVLISITVSPGRRFMGVGVLAVLGGLAIAIALGRGHASLLWQAMLLVFGVAVLYLAEMMRRASALQLDLTQEALIDSSGRVLARVDQIAGLDRGTLAVKPSNGFMIRLNEGQSRAWVPGVWWRMGRRIGIGGITSAGQTKAMAEMLEALLRAQNSDAET